MPPKQSRPQAPGAAKQEPPKQKPKPPKPQSLKWLFLSLWLYRIMNFTLLDTFFQPDEYYQSLEPAWSSTFGPSSGPWITWEWKENLRSSIHPLLFSLCYSGAAWFGHFLKASPSIRGEILVLAPRVLQAAFASVTDLCTYRFAIQLFGREPRSSMVALGLSLFSPWNWFTSTRTFSNSLEATLTIVAILFWPWEWFLEDAKSSSKPDGALKDSKKSQQNESADEKALNDLAVSVGTAAVACILRPTNVLIWITIILGLMVRGISASNVGQLATTVLFYGGTVLALSAAMDWHFYGDWVFPPLKFIYFNVVQSLAAFYGKNRTDYYVTEGLPLLLTTALPFAVAGMRKALRPSTESSRTGTIQSILASAVMTTVLALTLISHKEVRFLFPLLPLLHILAAEPLVKFFELDSKTLQKGKLALLALGILINIGIGTYTGQWHQYGVLQVTHYLRHEYEAHHLNLDTESKMTVGFLMPCHSTPWRSHLIYPDINAWALTCEPPLHLEPAQREGYMDEADIFYADPGAWIAGHMESLGVRRGGSPIGGRATGMEKRREWPQYLVFFDQLKPLLDVKLEGSGYEECWREFNTHWHDDWRRRGDVVVWCMR